MPKITRWIALFDTHGDQAHLPGLRAAFEFMLHWKPTIRIAGGDHIDLRPLRRASDEEVDSTLNDDMEACQDFLGAFRPTVYMYGNHEDRLRQWRERGGIRERLAYELEEALRRAIPKKCLTYEYCKSRGVHRLGKSFSVVHGYGAGVYALRRHVLTYGNVIMGHVHSNDMCRVERHDRAIGFSSGCLCRLDQDYNRAHLGTLRQSHGFMYGFIDKNKKVHAYQAYPVDGVWHFPSEMMEIRNV